MQDGHENTFGASQPKRPDELATNKNIAGAFENNDNIEAEPTPPQSTPEERVEAVEEGIRLTEISRNTALGDLEKWRSNKTTDPSHFEYHLPEIQNRISRAEHSITSSRLDIDVIKASPASPEEESAVVQKFIAGQVLESRTSGLKNKLSTIEKQETDLNERMAKNHGATEKLQAELAEIDLALEAGGDDAVKLKQHRRDLLVDINGVSDRYESLIKEKAIIDTVSTEKNTLQEQIKEITNRGVSDHELPKSIQEDPDFAACLREAESHSSEDSRQFNNARKYDPQEAALKLFRGRFSKKSSYYDGLSKEQADPNNEVPGTINEQTEAKQVVVTKEKTIDVIKKGIEKGVINDKPDFEKLKAEAIIDTKSFYDVEPARSEEVEFEYIDTRKIVGRPNANNYADGWAHEYDERQGRIVQIVDQINNPEDEAGVEKIFHSEDQPGDRIKLASYEGPAGPIYTVLDGTHRVAGVKASGLEKMPAEIYRTNYPYEKSSTDAEEIADWEDKIARGFISGSVETIKTEHGKQSVLSVTSEVLPWIRARNQNDVFKINQIYNQQYPGAIERAGFPPETLTDKTAFWAYMDGNFDQWKALQEEPQPEKNTSPEVIAMNESTEKRKPKTVTTAKGSVYTYLEDERTQRFKSVEGEMKEPQNVLTFIPRIDSIVDWKHFDRLPNWIKERDNKQVMEILASDYIHNPDKRVVLTNESNEIVRSNADAAKAQSLLLQFVDSATNQTEFALPVSIEPEIGATTYDARYFDKDGKEHMSAHIGNEIVSISYE